MSKYSLFLGNVNNNSRYAVINKTGEHVYESSDPKRYLDIRKKAIAASARKQKNDIMESMGLSKVKGAVSGKTYWE